MTDLKHAHIEWANESQKETELFDALAACCDLSGLSGSSMATVLIKLTAGVIVSTSKKDHRGDIVAACNEALARQVHEETPQPPQTGNA